MGFKAAAMALGGQTVTIEDPRLQAEEKLAIILGTEGDGLSKQTIARCDYTVRIPMSHGVDSLNVAAASAIAFWQLRPQFIACRKRRIKSTGQKSLRAVQNRLRFRNERHNLWKI